MASSVRSDGHWRPGCCAASCKLQVGTTVYFHLNDVRGTVGSGDVQRVGGRDVVEAREAREARAGQQSCPVMQRLGGSVPHWPRAWRAVRAGLLCSSLCPRNFTVQTRVPMVPMVPEMTLPHVCLMAGVRGVPPRAAEWSNCQRGAKHSQALRCWGPVSVAPVSFPLDKLPCSHRRPANNK